jgi:mannosyltransferase OCH1-like enzyme
MGISGGNSKDQNTHNNMDNEGQSSWPSDGNEDSLGIRLEVMHVNFWKVICLLNVQLRLNLKVTD